MKSFNYILFACFASAVASVNAGTISLDTLVDGNGNDYVFRDAAGVNMSSGIVTVGVFATLSDGVVGSQSFGTLAGDFTVLGSDLFNDIDAPFTEIVAGMTSIDSNYGAPGVNQGKTIYVFVGNNSATFSSSSEFFLLRTTSVIEADAPSDSNTLSLATSTVVFGTAQNNGVYDGDSIALSSNQPATNAINMVAVPEPSAAMLGALGMVGLLRRRRVA
jgi:hypothetical protein